MLFQILLLLGGVAMLWLSSDAIVRSIGPIARRFRVKEVVVAILGVSALSSLPELGVSMIAATRGNADVSLGNVIGSNFVTLTFVTALCALISPLTISKGIRDRESSWMILSTVAIMLLAQDGGLSRIDGIILVALYLPYLWSVIVDSRAEKHDDTGVEAPKRIWPQVIILLLGITGIILGSKFAMDGGESLGRAIGIPEVALGAVLFAFGTSLPELSIAVAATLKKKAEVSLAEVYASNIFTALVVLGVCAIAAPMQFDKEGLLMSFDIPMLIAAGVVIQIFITTGMKFNRIEAVLTMLLYAYFVYVHFVPGANAWSF